MNLSHSGHHPIAYKKMHSSQSSRLGGVERYKDIVYKDLIDIITI